MKTVILAGGRGSRLTEETYAKPKPMVEVGGIPILVHIMRLYAHAGFREFVLALGYRGDSIKDYFVNYHLRNSDVVVNLRTGETSYLNPIVPDWAVQMVDTGLDTLTGGRLKRLERVLAPEGTFMLTYGDGVADIDLDGLLTFHRGHGKLATVTAVRPPGRFGTMQIDGDQVGSFKEKPQAGEGWINGGFFVFQPGVFDYLTDDRTVLEQDPLERLSRDGQLMAYRHERFWQPMDTVRDRDLLNELWETGAAPWRRAER
jgi:glucose-1-phosphate cytidylyltransferase